MPNIRALLSHPTLLKLDSELETVFANAPHLPEKVIEILVKIVPYMVLISGLFMVTGGLQSIFGATEFYRILDLWRDVPSYYFYLVGVLQIIGGVLSIMAFKPLRDKLATGWQFMFVLSILNALMNLISVIFIRQGLFGLLIGLLLSFYFLYELKPTYFGTKSKIEKNTKKNK